jgi:uncharacterized protein YpbB
MFFFLSWLKESQSYKKMPIVIPISSKERTRRKNSRYYTKHGEKVRSRVFEKSILAMKSARPHWKSIVRYGLTLEKINALRNQKLSSVSDAEVESVEDFFTSLMLHVALLKKENL